MNGLLYKDIRMLFNTGKMYFIFIIGLIVADLFSSASTLFSLFAIIFISVLAPNTISNDEMDRWDIYSNLLPVTRGQYVSSKYILSFIFSTGVIIAASLSCIIKSGFNSNSLALISVFIIMGFIYPAIIFPVIFRFGYAKGKIAVFIFGGMLGGLVPISANSDFLKKMSIEDNGIIMAAAACVIFLFIVSWLVSIRIYSKKEF